MFCVSNVCGNDEIFALSASSVAAACFDASSCKTLAISRSSCSSAVMPKAGREGSALCLGSGKITSTKPPSANAASYMACKASHCEFSFSLSPVPVRDLATVMLFQFAISERRTDPGLVLQYLLAAPDMPRFLILPLRSPGARQADHGVYPLHGCNHRLRDAYDPGTSPRSLTRRTRWRHGQLTPCWALPPCSSSFSMSSRCILAL